MFCWQCGKHLEEKDGNLIFTEVTLPGGNTVKVHKVCELTAKAFQRFDTTPGSREEYWDLLARARMPGRPK